jgi:molybdopterin-containing oxidoreductase family membrane subunit
MSELEEILEGPHTYEEVSERIGGIVLERRVRPGWLLGAMIGFSLLMLFFVAIAWLLLRGVGIWGIQIPVAWSWAITNFVWWIGIGHAGTFISAFLYLMHQEWRNSINRFAEAMTIFAVSCAGLMPLLHLGRPWFFYWMIPYPNTMGLWPQFRSPLMWDMFAVGTYFTVSLLFWYLGMVPDLATIRDRAKNRFVKWFYGVIALGWRGSARHWARYKVAYLILAGLATPLVISVHSVVSMDFTIAIVPGWHSSIFPPYFVAGAIFSGFAMVLTLAIPMRKFYRLEDIITIKHLENCAKMLLVTGLIVAYSYVMEWFMALYSEDPFEKFIEIDRAIGIYKSLYWTLITCNVLVPQLLWFKKIRRNPASLFLIAILINIGMWVERFVIIAQSLHRDFLPSSWQAFYPTVWDVLFFAGSCGLFLFCFYLFARLMPVISIAEVRDLVHKKSKEETA